MPQIPRQLHLVAKNGKRVASTDAPVKPEPTAEDLRAQELMGDIKGRLADMMIGAGFTSAYGVDKATGLANARTNELLKGNGITRFSAVAAILYARALKVSVDYFLTGKDAVSNHGRLRDRDEWWTVFHATFGLHADEFPKAVWDQLGEVVLSRKAALTPDVLLHLGRALNAGLVENQPEKAETKKRLVGA